MQPHAHTRFVRQAGQILLMRLLPSLAATVVLILLARRLPPAQYGAYQSVWVKYYLLSGLGVFGLNAWMLTYPLPVLAGLVSGFGRKRQWLFGCWILAVTAVFAWLTRADAPPPAAILFLLSGMAATVAESLLMMQKRTPVLIRVNLFYAAGYCLLHYAGVQQRWDNDRFFWGLGLLGIARVALSGWSVRFNRADRAETTPVEQAAALRLWVSLGWNDLLQLSSRWIDKLVLSFLIPASLFAVYFNGAIDIPFLPLALSAAGTAGLMQLASETPSAERVRSWSQVSARLLSCITFPLFFFLLFYRRELFLVLFRGKYAASVPVFCAGLFLLPLRAFSFGTALQHYRRGDLILKGAAAEIVLALLLMYPLYQLAGLPGVAFSFVLSTYVQAGYYLLAIRKVSGIPVRQILPFRNWAVKLAGYGLLAGGIYRIFAPLPDPRLVLASGIAVLLAGMAAGAAYELKRKPQ